MFVFMSEKMFISLWIRFFNTVIHTGINENGIIFNNFQKLNIQSLSLFRKRYVKPT